MALQAPHLLTIPREIRDNIYSYLSHELSLFVGWQNLRNGEYYSDYVYIENAPFLNVLLTHSRLRDEYLEADCFQRLSMYVDFDSGGFIEDGSYTNMWRSNNTEPSVAHVRSLTIYVTDGEGGNNMPWSDVEGFANSLMLKASDLSTIRVAIHEWVAGGTELVSQHELENNEVSKAFIEGELFFSPPRDSLRGLPLRRCGQGYRYGYPDPYRVCPGGSGLEQKKPYHTVVKVGAWVFTKDEMDKQRLQVAEIVDHWDVGSCPQEVLDTMPQEEARKAVCLGLEIKEWKEVCGDAVRSWGIRSEDEDVTAGG